MYFEWQALSPYTVRTMCVPYHLDALRNLAVALYHLSKCISWELDKHQHRNGG